MTKPHFYWYVGLNWRLQLNRVRTKKTIVEKTVSSYEKDCLLTAKVKITKDQRFEFFNRECAVVSRSPLAQ